jgi:hypothetical protein
MIAYDPQTPTPEAIGEMKEAYHLAEAVEEPLDAEVCHNAPRLSRVYGKYVLVPG